MRSSFYCNGKNGKVIGLTTTFNLPALDNRFRNCTLMVEILFAFILYFFTLLIRKKKNRYSWGFYNWMLFNSTQQTFCKVHFSGSFREFVFENWDWIVHVKQNNFPRQRFTRSVDIVAPQCFPHTVCIPNRGLLFQLKAFVWQTLSLSQQTIPLDWFLESKK